MVQKNRQRQPYLNKYNTPWSKWVQGALALGHLVRGEGGPESRRSGSVSHGAERVNTTCGLGVRM